MFPSWPDHRELALSDLFTVGDLVLVDELLRAYIIAINSDEIGQMYFDLKYVIGNDIEKDVELNRLRVIAQNDNSSSRSHNNRFVSLPPSNPPQPPQPSQPSHQFPPPSNSTQQQSVTTTTTMTAERRTTSTVTISPTITTVPLAKRLKQCLKDSFSIKLGKKGDLPDGTEHPLYSLMKENKESKEKGWIRSIINEGEDEEDRVQLNQKEGTVLTVILSIFSGFLSKGGVLNGYKGYVDHAFGIGRCTGKNIVDRFFSNHFSVERKVRSDKGESVFNSERKRKNTFTAYKAFKKRKYSTFRDATGHIPEADLKAEFEGLSDIAKLNYAILAQQNYDRAETLWEELKDVLLKTEGKISYKTMASQLGGIVSESTIYLFLNNQLGYQMKTDRILPSLDTAAMMRRVVWAESFWLFWKSVMAVPVDRVIFVLIHMDEKWFYAVRTRTNCKVLVSIGLEGKNYYAHHKSHIGKEMYVACTAYVLCNGNNVTAGGKAVPIACVRVGKMVRAKKDSYKRVYNADGTYGYPQVEANKLRSKGELYFKGLELNGSSEGTEKDPKVSLLKIYQDEIIPAIEEKIVRKFNNNGTRRVVIVKQEDGAGPHNDRTYLSEMRREFSSRGWILFNQPSQSPITNVHDACIFPMLSKAVSREQVLAFGSTLMKGEHLNQTVMKAWEDDTNRIAMARAFAGHSQIVCAILHHNGDNNYLSQRGGLSFGIRRTFVSDPEGEGVIPVTLAAQNEAETAQGIILNEAFVQGLKYTPPDLRSLQHAKLTTEMRDLLLHNMNPSLMNEELNEVWSQLRAEMRAGGTVM